MVCYPIVKKIEDMFIRFDRMYERDRQTDRHRMTAKAALAYHRAAKMSGHRSENGSV